MQLGSGLKQVLVSGELFASFDRSLPLQNMVRAQPEARTVTGVRPFQVEDSLTRTEIRPYEQYQIFRLKFKVYSVILIFFFFLSAHPAF